MSGQTEEYACSWTAYSRQHVQHTLHLQQLTATWLLQEKKQLVFEGTVGKDAEALGRLTEDDLRFLFG